MKLGIVFANTAKWVYESAGILAQTCEELDFDSVWTVEHVVLPKDFKSPYPYTASGKMPGGDKAIIPDPIIWLAYLASLTTKLKLATGIVILPQRNPLMFAKEIATLDLMSKGRVILGVGIGWLKEEFEALDVEFSTRAMRTEETIGALRALWTQEIANYHGELINFDNMRSNPKPYQKNGVPIIIGGHSLSAAKRAGKIGDGFFPAIQDPETLYELVKVMKQSAEEAGRDPSEIEITFPASFDEKVLERYVELGVSRVVVPPVGTGKEELAEFLGNCKDQVLKITG